MINMRCLSSARRRWSSCGPSLGCWCRTSSTVTSCECAPVNPLLTPLPHHGPLSPSPALYLTPTRLSCCVSLDSLALPRVRSCNPSASRSELARSSRRRSRRCALHAVRARGQVDWRRKHGAVVSESGRGSLEMAEWVRYREGGRLGEGRSAGWVGETDNVD
jgi:hypothetical protein